MTSPQATLTDASIEASTRRWVKRMVVDLGFCPFAARVLNQPGALLINIVRGSERQRLQWLLERLHELRVDQTTETVLMVMPADLAAFEDFLDFASLAEAVLESHGFSGEFQIATFHPDYCFADSSNGAVGDAANYTNRSPYPALHILREQSISDALENFADPEKIPQRNISYARSIGTEKLAQRLESCFDADGRIAKP